MNDISSFLLAVIFGCFVSGLAFVLVDPDRPEPDPKYMMECVYDYGQTADACRDIWEGKDPPPLPEYKEGC